MSQVNYNSLLMLHHNDFATFLPRISPNVKLNESATYTIQCPECDQRSIGETA